MNDEINHIFDDDEPFFLGLSFEFDNFQSLHPTNPGVNRLLPLEQHRASRLEGYNFQKLLELAREHSDLELSSCIRVREQA